MKCRTESVDLSANWVKIKISPAVWGANQTLCWLVVFVLSAVPVKDQALNLSSKSDSSSSLSDQKAVPEQVGCDVFLSYVLLYSLNYVTWSKLMTSGIQGIAYD